MSTSAVKVAKSPPPALVVTANPVEFEQIAKCLQPFYRMVRATTLREADLNLPEVRPVVVVLDPDLPDGDGVAWLRRLRNNPAHQDLVVACVTHRSTVRDKINGFLAGADDYVVYPINSETFGYRLSLLVRIGRYSAWKQ
jgi:two-component system, glycerol uptake and utilization response regulator